MDSILSNPLFKWGLIALVVLVVLRAVAQRLGDGGADKLLTMVLGDTWTRFKVNREARGLIKQGNYLGAGVIYEEAGHHQEAIDAYLQGQELVAAATVYETRRKFDKAAELFLKAGESKRGALMLVEAGRLAKAAALLEADGNKLDAAKLYTDSEDYAKAGALYLDAGFPQRAAEVFERSGEHRRAAECYERHFSENVTYSTTYSSTAPSKDRQSAQKAGRMWEQAGELGRAVEIYAQGNYFSEAAEAAVKQGDHARAAELFERAERLDRAADCWAQAGEPEKAAQRRGDVAFKAGEVEQAAGFFAEARDYLRAAELYESIDLWERAGDTYSAGESHSSAGGAYLRAKRKDLAAAAYEKGWEYETAAKLFEEIGQEHKAAQLFEKAGLTFRSGQAAAAAGRREEAIALLQRVDPQQEHYGEATELLGQLFVETGQPELAVGRLVRALGQGPVARDTLGLYYWLARAHEAAGHGDQAQECYRQILAEDMQYEDVTARSRALAANAATGPVARPPAEAAASAVRAAPAVKDGNRIGKYEIVGSLGKGAMGEVRRARDTVLERNVAIKVMSASVAGDPDLKERFEREAKAVAAMAHPNIVTVYDLGYNDDGSPFIAMELLRGRDLRSALLDGALDLELKIEIVAQVLAGLAHAHDTGIVHRDIKPANIFLQDDGTVKILDFGVARLTTASMTGTGSVMGTADYMSPEQVQGKRVDGRSDVFSVGVMLSEMLSGARPFSGESVMTTFYKITHEPPDLSRLPPDPEIAPLRALIERSLEKDVDQRYQTAAEFAADLRALQMRRQSPGGRADASWPPLGTPADVVRPTIVEPVPDPATAAPRSGRFVDVTELARGPLGTVFRARDTKHDRVVAMRALPGALPQEDLRLLVADLKSAASVAHRNVARVLGVFDSGDRLFVLGELVEGKNCAAPLLAGRRMGLAQVIGLGKVLSSALEAIHAKGLVHGSVQPSNVVFGEGGFKLTDLGLARLVKELPPSPYRTADAVGSDADLRAVVAVLYHLYTGVAPSADAPFPPSQLRDGTPDGFDRLAARGLAGNRGERFSTSDELLAALENAGA